MLSQVTKFPLKFFSIIVFSIALIACGGSEYEVADSLSGDLQASLTSSGSEVSFELSGVVGDGPVINANITVKDATGAVIATTVSDESAHYSVTIPEGSAYPLTLSVADGMNTITNEAPAFQMISLVEGSYQTTANINSFTTLITKSAEAMSGGLKLRNISLAKLQVTNSLSFGLNNSTMPDAVASEVTEMNVASYVKASVAMSEWIRRTHVTLVAEDESWIADRLVSILSADLVDGVLDGQGPGADEMVAATANVLSAQVLIESLSQTLQVAGISVMGST